jgi:hypothetical protein
MQQLKEKNIKDGYMTFLEAVEANNTKRVRLIDEDGIESPWYPIKSIGGSSVYPSESVFGKWEAEKVTKIDFTCTWDKREFLTTGSEIPVDVIFPDGFLYSVLENFVGLKTKVSVEVIP